MKNFWSLFLAIPVIGFLSLSVAAVPMPPMQGKPWRMPDSVADKGKLIEQKVNELFKFGYADPRGCEYRNLELTYGKTIQKGRGWVLPITKGEQQRYAIGWSGLIYPISKIGKIADLKEDIKGGQFKPLFIHEFLPSTELECFSQLPALSFMNSRSAAPYLLLRLGIFVKVLDGDNYSFSKKGDRSVALNKDELVIVQLQSLALAVRSDGVEAYYAKNYSLAEDRLKSFDKLWGNITNRYRDVRLKIDPVKLRAYLSQKDDESGVFFTGFDQEIFPPKLNPYWRGILLDAKRRRHLSKQNGLTEIEQLIDSLDQVKAWNYVETGGYVTVIPPRNVSKIIGFGTAAIKPLLDCLKNDKRWTLYRGYQDHDGDLNNDLKIRDVNFLEIPIPVANVAIYALQEILMFDVVEYPLNQSPFNNDRVLNYEKSFTDLLSLCSKHNNTRGAELWYKILKDESALFQDQLKVMKRVLREEEEQNHFYGSYRMSFMNYESIVEGELGLITSREGKQLRHFDKPSVKELITNIYYKTRKRVDENIANGAVLSRFPVTPGGYPISIFDGLQTCVGFIEKWEPGNIELLRSHYEWLLKYEIKNPDDCFISQYSLETIMLRYLVDDKTAYGDYKKHLLLESRLQNFDFGFIDQGLDEKQADEVLKLIFLNPESILNFKHPEGLTHLLGSSLEEHYFKLLRFVSFREAVIQALESKEIRVIRNITKKETYDVFLPKLKNPPFVSDETKAAPILQKIELRLCDFVIDTLLKAGEKQSQLLPGFDVNTSIKERDEVVQQWINLLKNKKK